jgi:hypothetical protein
MATIRKSPARKLAYNIWRGMHQRCSNREHPAWPYYGDRGITVCERWAQFEHFYADMGDAPPGLMLERIDNSIGYSPENCRWASRTEQNRNRRPYGSVMRSKWLTFEGQSMPIKGWESKLGVGHGTIYSRLKKGWPLSKALTLTKQG